MLIRTRVRWDTIAAVTDMRATERLLEFIAERSDDERVLEAVAELQRRGETLVRGPDVQAVATAAFRWLDEYRGLERGADDELAHAIERLENAIGGR